MKIFIPIILLFCFSNLYAQDSKDTISYKTDSSYTVSNTYGSLNVRIITDSTNLGKFSSLVNLKIDLNQKALNYELWDRTKASKVLLRYKLTNCTVTEFEVLQDFNALSEHCKKTIQSLFQVFSMKHPDICAKEFKNIRFKTPFYFKAY